jgi:predicted Ser/Thr protein kinase/tetratricopeptide (TPR) repeat protein
VNPGDVLADRFEIERAVGYGGMGMVYRALDRHTGQPVALKTLRHASEDHMRRFAKEAETMYKLQHPRVVRYLAHGRTEQGELFLVMEWLEGESLAERLRRSSLTLDETYKLALGVAEAIGVAHERGVLHRDIKPDNLFLVGKTIERLKLIDFGLARMERAAAGPTLTGDLVGTPGYMSPEQARGDKTIDARTDIFSLGCVLFRCLTGRRPFEGDDALAVLAKLVLETPPRVSELRPGLPHELDDLVARMLAKDRAARPADGAKLVAQLKAIAPAIHAATGVGEAPRSLRENLPSLTGNEQRVMCLVLARAEATVPPSVSATVGQQHNRIDVLPAALQPFGGKVDKLIDGSILVTVGAGAPSEQAARAGRCALAVRAVLGSVPVALTAGRGMVSRGALLGEAIDRAVGLLGLDRRDAVRVDEAAAALMRDRFEVGRDDRGFFLRGAQHEDDQTRRLLGKATSCVGRSRELRSLEALFEECVSEPVARAVLVTAPAGAGKSRLRHELIKRLITRGSVLDEEGDERPFQIWLGRGDPMSAGSAFGMLGSALRSAAGIRTGESIALRRQKLENRLARCLAAGDCRRVTEFVGELIGTPFDSESVQLRAARSDPMLMGERMRGAFEDFLAAECRANPVLLVLEDLHWGDLPSINFLDAALRNLGDEPWMVLAFARPEVHEMFPSLWRGRDLQEIRLGRLTKKACAKLIEQVLGEAATEEIVERLAQQSEGNAFFLEELIRAVAEGQGQRLPDSVLAMVQARLEALDSEARRVLRAASVFGQVFWRGGVVALLGGATKIRPDLDDWITALIDAEMIVHKSESRFPGEVQYEFRHGLMREAAYAALTENDRELGHRLAARWLSDAGEEEAVVLAEHFERGAEAAHAVRWYRRAAEQALEGDDLQDAIRRAERGIAAGAKGEELGALRLIQADAHRWRGEFAQMESSARVALELLPEGHTAWCKASAELAVACRALGHYDDLARVAERLSLLTPPRDHRPAFAAAAARVAQQLYLIGWSRHADALLARVADAEEVLADTHPEVVAWIYHAKAFGALHAGESGAYLQLAEAAVGNFQQAGDLRSATNSRGHLGNALLEVGGYPEAEETLREALAAARRMGLHNVVITAMHNLGIALAHQGKLDEALRLERDAAALAGELGNRRIEGASRHAAAKILAMQRQLAEAEQEARLATLLLQVAPPLRAHALSSLATIVLAQARGEEAIALAREAMQFLDQQGGIEEGEAAVRLAFAESAHATGDVATARRAIALAAERLSQRAARISVDHWRESFMTRVPENARTISLNRAWNAA